MCPYLFQNGTDSPVHITNWADQLFRNNSFRNEPYKILGLRSERCGMSDTFTDVDRWSGTVPLLYGMDRVLLYLANKTKQQINQTISTKKKTQINSTYQLWERRFCVLWEERLLFLFLLVFGSGGRSFTGAICWGAVTVERNVLPTLMMTSVLAICRRKTWAKWCVSLRTPTMPAPTAASTTLGSTQAPSTGRDGIVITWMIITIYTLHAAAGTAATPTPGGATVSIVPVRERRDMSLRLFTRLRLRLRFIADNAIRERLQEVLVDTETLRQRARLFNKLGVHLRVVVPEQIRE